MSTIALIMNTITDLFPQLRYGVITLPNKVSLKPEEKLRNQTRSILLGYFRRCKFNPIPPVYDQHFEDLVFQSAAAKGWDVDSMRSTLIVGAGITSTSYGHVEDLQTKLYIAQFTALVVVIDDLCTKDPVILDGVAEFIKRFRSLVPQKIRVLEYLEKHVLECDKYFHPTAADVIIWGTLRFISGCYLESLESDPHRTRPSEEYCYYLRDLSGIPEPYGMFIFAPTIPFTAYKDAIPSICDFINFNNDLLSFYKEEFAGEDNMVTYLSQVQNLDKFEVLSQLAEKTCVVYERGVAILTNEEARSSFKSFAAGYVDFHTGLKRYKFEELGITQKEL